MQSLAEINSGQQTQIIHNYGHFQLGSHMHLSSTWNIHHVYGVYFTMRGAQEDVRQTLLTNNHLLGSFYSLQPYLYLNNTKQIPHLEY